MPLSENRMTGTRRGTGVEQNIDTNILAPDIRCLGPQDEGVAATPHVEHPLVVEVEAGLKRDSLPGTPRSSASQALSPNDRGRDEGHIGILGDQLRALGVHHQHQRRRSEGRDFLPDAGEGRGGQQEQSKSDQAKPHGDFSAGEASAPCGPMPVILKRQATHITEFPLGRREFDPTQTTRLDGIENLYSRLRAGRRLQLRQNRNSPCYPLLTGERGPRRTRI